MDYKLLVFITLASCCFAAELPCPQDCRCRAYKLSNVHASCTNLDPKSQKFLMKVNHLKVVNQHHGEGLVLTDKFFVEMGLDKLETIRITNSSVKQVHPAAFHGLESLRLIDLSENDIKKLDSETFINNKNLKHLILNGNPIQIGHSEKPFLTSDSILELTLSNCDIARIPAGIFSNLRNLEFLDLSGNRLSEINADTFGRLINLETLQLGNNRISKIDKKAFDDMDELSMLSLKGNNIRTVEGLEIGTLKELDLSDCKFEVLMGDTFAGFPDIYSLNLSGNSIREINKDTFTDMISLRYLDLSRNNIRGPLDQFLFEFNHQLETLSFAGNKELDTFPGFLREFGALYKLDLSDCGLNSLSAYSFKGMPFIDTLNISGNNLGHIPPKTFYGLAHLTVLDISRNRLYGLSNKIFFNNLHLRKLFVSHNYFSTLPAILFSGTPGLSWLDMSHNHIIRLWNISESFVMKNRNILGKLTYLNAAGNRLKTLHMHSFISMRGLETLDISGNPIMCTQDFSHVMQWLIGQKVVPSLEMGRNADSANLIKNNIQWQETLDQMCPIDAESRNVAYKSQSLVNKVKLHVDKSGQEIFKEVTENPEMIEDVPYIISPVSDESSIVWPMVLVWLSIVSIMLAIGNIFAFVIYKYCRGHNTVHYTPAPSLSGHFLVRRGGKSEYKKLYAECTEPAQVHANNSKIITILGFPQSSKINSNV